uniref:Fibrinogen C-terminal domain-containing protein n=1 Tax=Biomphalaria glabrata TaxID=6526 RepID=A0A2C9KCR8_BIOGL
MRNNIEIFISNVNFTQALYQKRLDKAILGAQFSPPKSCRDIYSTEDRVVVTLASGLKVMCDTKTDGGGWIIFQRRINGKVDFYRGWKEYRDGFGDYIIGEFYLGNEKIFMLTSKLHYEMRVDLAYENTTYFATFSTFKLLGENDIYKLHIGNYIGTAGDSLKRQNNSFFSTFDRDNDSFSGNCAIRRRGAWWYKDCSDSNLNGEWANNNLSAVYWDTVAEWKSATFTEMKIREYK